MHIVINNSLISINKSNTISDVLSIQLATAVCSCGMLQSRDSCVDVLIGCEQCMARMSPAHSAPAAVADSYTALRPDTASTGPRLSTDEIETDTEYQDAHTEMNQGHTCENEANQPKQGKVGRFRARIAPNYHKNCTHKQISKDSIKDKQIPGGNVQPHGHHHTKNVNHHQCCGAFGNPHVRHKTSNSSCRLI